MEEQVLELLKREFPEIDFKASDKMTEDGTLDSLAVTGIVAALTLQFDVEIPYEEVTKENFNSLAAIVSLVEDLSE